MVKLLSLLISFLLVFGSVAPSYAQTKGSASPKKTLQPTQKETFFEKQKKAVNASLEGVVDSAKLEKSLTETVQKEKKEEDDTYWVNLGASFVKESCHIRGIPCILDRLDKAEQEAGGDILKAVVCSEKDPEVCVSALAYAQGGVHYAIQHFLYYQGNTIVESAGNFAHLVTEYGLHSEKDRQDAMKYFYDVLSHTDEDCGSGFPLEYGSSNQRADQRLAKERKFQLCSAEVGAMPALAMLGKTQAENKKIAETIYAILEEYYSATSASIVISGATTALGILGTPRAYGLLEEFLMDETIPSTVGNALNSLSFSGMTQNMLRAASNIRGGDSRYLNRINESFQYLDNQELTRQGFQSALFEGEAIQYPYGNLLEDVGRMIGEQSATNANARRVAKVIITKANQYAKDGTHAAGAIHYPVVLGIMDAYRTFGKKYIYEPAPELVALFYKGDWFDINEGTQQRVHYKAYQFAKARGWTYKAPTRDKEKIQRYIYNSRLMSMGEIADLVSMIFIAGGLVKAVPALLKGIPSAVRTLSARKTWIGTKNYIKTLPRRTVKQVKIAPAKAKRGATRRVESAKAAVSSRAQKVQAAASRFKNKVTGKKSPTASGETTAGATSSAARGETVGVAQGETVTSAVKPAAIEEQILSPLNARVQQANTSASQFSFDEVASISGKRGVFQLKDKSGKVIAYLKFGKKEEISRTQMIKQLIKDKGLREKYPNIEIEFPQVITEGRPSLPKAVDANLEKEISLLRRENSSRGIAAANEDTQMFAMTTVETDGINYGDLTELKFDVQAEAWESENPTQFFQEKMRESLLKPFNNQPLTPAEWGDAKGLIGDLNKSGFEHGDLGQNLFLKRDAQTGKLKVTLIDFEPSPAFRSDQSVLDAWQTVFDQYQIVN